MGGRIRIRPPRDRHPLWIGPQILALKVAKLVVRLEIGRLKTRAAFEPDDLDAGFAQLGREDTARSANADDHNIGFLDGHGSAPLALEA